MQRVIVFRKLSFWTSQPDLRKLNEKITELNRDGWRVTNIVPASGFTGMIRSYTLLVEREPQPVGDHRAG